MNLRSRFSIRTLLVLVSLVGLYFGCWEQTKRLALKPDPPFDLEMHRLTSPRKPPTLFSFDASPGPFVISRDRIGAASIAPGASKVRCIREYHFWFFGFTAKLPFEREVELPLIEGDPLAFDVEGDGIVRPNDF